MELREYQRQALEHFARHDRCALWAGMGMGKTVTTLTHVDALATVEGARTLVIAPRRVAVGTWPEEAAKWGFDRVQPITGTAAERAEAIKVPALAHTINPENIPWLVEHCGDDWPFDTIVADESTRLKGFRLRKGGKRTVALATVTWTKVKRFYELTGTPAANGLIDLWGQLWFLDKGSRLGRTYTAFIERWFRQGHNGYGYNPLPYAFREITERCADLCMTIDPADWFDLRQPIVTDVFVDLPVAARKLYRELEREMFAALTERTVTAVNAAAKSSKLLQLANGAVYLDPLTEDDTGPKDWKVVHDAKLEALDSIIEESAGAPILVAYQFQSDLARLRKHLPSARTLDDGKGELERWNRGDTPVLLVHPASAGHGLNLQQGGNILVFFGHWWNLEERLQVIERIGPVRQLQSGFNRPVFIYNIITRDTVDEVVVDRGTSKKTVQDALMGYMKRKRA